MTSLIVHSIVKKDGITSAATGIDYAHHELHGGSSFTCHYTQDVSDTNDRSIIVLKTPAAPKYCHTIVAASSTAAALAKITEAPTVTNDTGATLAVYNRRRVGTPNESGVIDISQDPDTANAATYFTEATMGNVTVGTVIAMTTLGAAGAGVVKQIGGVTRETQEWILKASTLYAFELISLDDTDNTHWIEVSWYEHTE